jgi:hypothetical protein
LQGSYVTFSHLSLHPRDYIADILGARFGPVLLDQLERHLKRRIRPGTARLRAVEELLNRLVAIGQQPTIEQLSDRAGADDITHIGINSAGTNGTMCNSLCRDFDRTLLIWYNPLVSSFVS